MGADSEVCGCKIPRAVGPRRKPDATERHGSSGSERRMREAGLGQTLREAGLSILSRSFGPRRHCDAHRGEATGQYNVQSLTPFGLPLRSISVLWRHRGIEDRPERWPWIAARRNCISHLPVKSCAKCAKLRNPKHEVRNPKQIQMSKAQHKEKSEAAKPNVSNSETVSDCRTVGLRPRYELRISGSPGGRHVVARLASLALPDD
jgi:hypothetical protein